MPKKIKIKTLDQDGNNEEIVEFEFTDDEWETLQDFAKYAGELRETSLVKEGIPTSLNINWTMGGERKVEATIPNDNEIAGMLMKLRGSFLLQKKTPTYFPRVRNILLEAAKNQRITNYLDRLKDLFTGRSLQSIFVVGASSRAYPNGVILNDEDMLDAWFYGTLGLHRNKEKEFNAMRGSLPPESSIALLMFLVADKVAAILAIERIISSLAKESETMLVETILEEPIHYHALLHASVTFSILPVDEEPRPLPQVGDSFARVFDLTHMGPAMFHHFLDSVGQLWMHGQMVYEIGECFYFFRVAPGFRVGKAVHEFGVDIIASVKAVAYLVEDPGFEARRKPKEAMFELMRVEREGGAFTKQLKPPIETKEELDRIFDRDPKPLVNWVVVPRLAFEYSYLPISKKAKERFNRISSEGREPTFEEVEGTDISQAWEIFDEEGDDDERK